MTEVSGSLEPVSPPKKEDVKPEAPKSAPKKPAEIKYRLVLHASNGTIRSDIPKSVVGNMTMHFGDLIRAIPSDRYVSAKEIHTIHLGQVKRLGLDRPRTEDEVKRILVELTDASLVEQKHL